ncbi:MAG: hypothetical protein AB1586_19435 [Pseudomonadota bacterium]
MPLPQQVLELAYWLPLIAFGVLSLGIVSLKWMPSLPLWATSLGARPFFLISLPAVVLLMGVEIFLFVAHSLCVWFFDMSPSQWPDAITVLLLGNLFVWPRETLLVLASGGALCIALVGSGYALRREFSCEHPERNISNKARQMFKGFALAVAFILTWLSLRYVIVHFESSRFMDLRIV